MLEGCWCWIGCILGVLVLVLVKKCGSGNTYGRDSRVEKAKLMSSY